MTMRWNGAFSVASLPAGLIAYTAGGLPIVASGAVSGTNVNDSFNATAQTPVQPGAAVLASATSIM